MQLSRTTVLQFAVSLLLWLGLFALLQQPGMHPGAAHILAAIGVGGGRDSSSGARSYKRGPCGGMLHTNHTVFKEGAWEMCQAVHKVCFDQERIIMYDEAYNLSSKHAAPLPSLDLSRLAYNWAGTGENGDQFHDSRFDYDPLTIRYTVGKLEPSPDLQHPTFSSCTVPVVMWTNFVHNFGEWVSHVVARVWAAQHQGAMSRDSTLVVGTPAGERGRPYVTTTLEAFSPYAVTTFAEFSQRRPPRRPSHTTAEGKPLRCFQTAYLCAFTDDGYWPGMYEGLQAVYRHHKAKRDLPPPAASFSGGPEVFKVLIDRRKGSVRNILNSSELVAECNRFRKWRLDPALPVKKVECQQVTLTSDNLRNMATVRAADMLVSVHGAGCINWLFMRQGSALLELRPYQFGSAYKDWANHYYPRIAREIDNKVLWFALDIEDPALNKPSKWEAKYLNSEHSWTYFRDRHIKLPFWALQTMIERAIACNRTSAVYKRRRWKYLHYAQLFPRQNLTGVRDANASPGEKKGE